MSKFEKLNTDYQLREERHSIEKHPTIELSDKEYLSTKEIKVITLHDELPSIPMNLDMPILEQLLRKYKKNEKSKSKIVKQKPEKNNKKSKQAAMENL